MQPIPPYWHKHEEAVPLGEGRTYLMVITGSSHISQEDAERDARERLAQLLASGFPDDRAPRDWYYPARRLPEELLEEIPGGDGEPIAAITRNRYGAEILNTDALLITDVDLFGDDPQPARASEKRPGLLRRLFGGGSTAPPDAASPSASGTQARREQARERTETMIAEFAQRNPQLGVRSYRTRNGSRVLITGADAPPDSQHALRMMSELTSDKLYMTLCRVQGNYRARLTPKPWRIGVAPAQGHGPGRMGIGLDPEWVRGYDTASQQYGVCELVSAVGPAPTADEQRVIDLHDAATLRAGLPLA